MRERYGASANGLIDCIKRNVASALLQKTLERVDSGDIKLAISTFAQILLVKPTYLLRPELMRMWFRLRNARRVIANLKSAQVR